VWCHVDELVERGIQLCHIHAIARGVDFSNLPEAARRQKKDIKFRLEWFICNTTLTLFAVALTALVTSLIVGSVIWAVVSLFVMVLTFIAGEQFAVHVPDVQLTDFTNALSHGEVLLMVDVTRERVAEIENHVHHRHAEASVGGVGWNIDALDM
jgi:hypothetical protein